MKSIIRRGVDPESFLEDAAINDYGMQRPLIYPAFTTRVSKELEDAGFLEDYVELEDTEQFRDKGMRAAALLHDTLNNLICRVEDKAGEWLPLFSVRVFEPGLHATTIHRNDPCIGPWAIGITLRGEAPFSVYEQGELQLGQTIELSGYDDIDPIPYDTMDANAGSAWALYTRYAQMPHSGGMVHSTIPRELLIFYGTQNN